MKKIQDINLKWGLIAFSSLLFLFLVHLSATNVIGATITINGIERASDLDTSGTSYGELHDRQDLGKIMTKGSQLKISSSEELTPWLLTNNKATETYYEINGTKQTITADVDATPFIATPRNNSSVSVDYEFSGTTTDLPIFRKNGNVQNFLS